MKKALFALALASLGMSAAWAQDSNNAELLALRAECAAKHAPQFGTKAPAANEYRFVYSKGQYRGEQQAGETLACTEGQYAAYLNTQDPTRVMSAYPTAAGRPKAQ